MTTACNKTILFDYPNVNLLDEVLSQTIGTPHVQVRRGSPDPVEASPSASVSNTSVIGRCLHPQDPAETGRVLVAYRDEAGEEQHRWLTPLSGMAIERDDELLLLEPRGGREPIIAGVLTRRPARSSSWPLEMALAAGETLSIVASNGAKLVEIAQQEEGPVVRMCEPDVQVQLPGKLRIDAAQIDLHSHAGGVQIESAQDVAIRGAVIRLN